MERHGSNTSPSREPVDYKPLPSNFDEYIPWACLALQELFVPIITRSIQQTYDSAKGKKEKPLEPGLADKDSDTSEVSEYYHDASSNVHIGTVYDHSNALIQLKLCGNKKIPRNLLKLIGLILPFHTQVSTICINKGLCYNGLYEVSKMLFTTFITEIILDGTTIKEGNYYCLLDQKSNLKYLSLSRCSINDAVVKELTARLLFPLGMSKILSALNLSSNKITNNGAKHIGLMLKSNRQLAYLNLSGNLITDKGGEFILNSLIDFSLTIDEVVLAKTRKHAYLNLRNDMIKRTVEEMMYIDLTNTSKSKSDKMSSHGRRFTTVRSTGQSIMPRNQESYTELAQNAVLAQLGPFIDPYSSENIVNKNGTVYCLGNNTLCYLSLAYNDLTNLFVKQLYTVLTTQHNYNRKPRGLLNVNIDGNDISDSCGDLARINFIIDRGLTPDAPVAVNTVSKKKGK